VVPELTEGLTGLLIGDKGYIRPYLREKLLRRKLVLQTPFKKNMKDNRPKKFIRLLMAIRRRIETVIGQLAERFHIEKIRARDTWHEASRFWRKLLAHTTCVKIGVENGLEPLQFERLIAC
jgi:hypothetical protein